MHAFVLLGLSAFLLCLFFTPIFRDLFLRAGLVDHPDGERRFHIVAVPRMGGVPIVVSYAAALLLAVFFNPVGGRMYIQHQQLFTALLPAAAIIFVTGLLDDLIGLKPWQKLIGQFAGSILAVTLGVRLSLPHVSPALCAVISVVWLISCANAVNLIDGMDGLAAGVGLLASLCVLIVALREGNVGLALAVAPLAGCLLAFLRYNFAPASVFLGDCGSLTIGFVLGCFALIWSHAGSSLLGLSAPLMALALPLIDVCLAIGRRFLRSTPIFQGDRGHIHHMVLGLGFSTRAAALLLYGVCCISASLAILATFSNKSLAVPILALFLTLVVLGIGRLGYVEFSAVLKIFSTLLLRRAVQDQIYLEELRGELQVAADAEAWWRIVCRACTRLDFASARLELPGLSFYEQFVPTHELPACHIHLGLGTHGSLVLTRLAERSSPRAMMSVLHQLQMTIRDKVTLSEAESRSAAHRGNTAVIHAA